MEKVYENALLAELEYRGIKAENQELKATEFLLKIHDAQILNYLRATGFKIGLLINFTDPKAEIKRFIL